MKIELERTEIEIPYTKNGEPTYRWVKAFFVSIDGRKIYPPMRVREALKYVKKIESEAQS